MSSDGTWHDYLHTLVDQVGYREGANNANKYSNALGRPNESWCSDFVVETRRMAGVPEISGATASAYTPTAEAGYKAAGRLYSKPAPGRQFFVYSPSSGRVIHTGIVIAVSKDGDYVHTIEGNTNDDGSANGVGVFRRVRPAHRSSGRAGIRSYGEPKFNAPAMPVVARHPVSASNKTLLSRVQNILHVQPNGIWNSAVTGAIRGVRDCYFHGAPNNHELVKQLQLWVGATPDGVWGPKSKLALTHTIARIQATVGVTPTGKWGPRTNGHVIALAH